VHQLTCMGKKHGFSVVMLSHASSFSREGAKSTLGEDAGIVGIACVPNLCAGGWKAKALGLPAQCVLLDYCGCRSHWHEEGIPTDINIKQLARVLGLDQPHA
ncbi:MAG TPA: DUF116 domain-containing protein, partial [Symbiobacteriaceae bacterium]|nr:DUF116 domain-containing protein [Symbiobacteriaceae bacterium]